MRQFRSAFSVFALLGLLFPLTAAASSASFKKVFIVVLENTNSTTAHSQPFLRQLARDGADLTGFVAESHPSQGNYIALTSGSLNGVRSDWNVDLDVQNIADLLEAKGKSWKAYAEQYPGNCFQGSSDGDYVRKHMPFISYVNIQQRPERCAKLVNATQLDSDLAAGQLPDYSFYVPDIKNDGHDTGAAYADNFMRQRFGALLHDSRFMKDMLFIVTFDESAGGPNGIYTTFYGDSVQPGSAFSAPSSHYSILRMIEDAWQLGSLNQLDAQASVITGIWK